MGDRGKQLFMRELHNPRDFSGYTLPQVLCRVTGVPKIVEVALI